MNWYEIFWLFSIADGLSTAIGWFIVIFTIIAIISTTVFLVFLDENSPERLSTRKPARRWMWWTYTITLILWIAYILVPSKKDMILIVAGGAVGEFVTNDSNARQLPADMVRFVRKEILDATAEIDGGEIIRKNLNIQKASDTLKDKSKEELQKLLELELEKNE